MVPALPPVADIATEVWCIAARVSPEHCAPALGPASHLIIYHYVVEGDLHLRMQGEGENGEEVVIGAGEIVLLPRNDLHIIGSDLTLPPVAGREVIHPPKNGGLFSIHHGGNGKRTRMVCGFLGCAKGEANPVISSLPRVSLPLEGRVPARRSGRAGIET